MAEPNENVSSGGAARGKRRDFAPMAWQGATREVMTLQSGGAAAHAPAGRETLAAHASRRLAALCAAVGFDDAAVQRARRTVADLMHPWGALPVGETGGWSSDIADDHSPFEFSVVLSESGPERYLDGGLLGYAPPEGLPELRKAARSLRRQRGLAATPEQIFDLIEQALGTL